tara:strand:+ start:1452 stop:1967 length:516 start_codon:yes stop_codon:yes gene_type:complete
VTGAVRLLWAGGLAALLCFVALAVMSKFWLEPDGLIVFDSRLRGYDPAAARAYLAALSADQRALYLGAFRVLDTVFPIVLAGTLAGVIWRGAGVRLAMVRVLALLMPGVYLMLDLTENALVAVILRGQATDATIVLASALTQGKWLVLAVAMLLAVWAMRRGADTQQGRMA